MAIDKKGWPFKVADFIGLFNFKSHGQNKVDNIAIRVLWRGREKLYCKKQASCWTSIQKIYMCGFE